MRQAIIDCGTGKVIYIQLSPTEEAKRLEEIETERGRQVAEEKQAAKRQLARALAELREMRQNRDDFDEADLIQKQAEVDELRGRLN